VSERGWWVPVVWGTLLAGLGVVAAFWTSEVEAPLALLLGGGAAIILGGGIYLAGRRRSPFDASGAHAHPRISPPTLLAAVGLTVILVSSYGGLWVLLIGAGLLLLALVGLAGELWFELGRQHTAAGQGPE
jgi:hypothetical protein